MSAAGVVVEKVIARGGSSSFDEEQVAFLRRRLRLACGLLLVLVAGLYVLPKALYLLVEGGGFRGVFLNRFALVHLGSVVPILLCWARLGREGWSERNLRIVDAGLLWVTVPVCLLLLAIGGREPLPIVYSVLILLLVTRAVFVPSRGRRTFLLSAPAVPAFVAVFAFLVPEGPFSTPGLGTLDRVLETFFYALLLAGAVGLATLASNVTFSLRREVHEARRLGQYVLGERIGGGGMGEVYRATHALLKRPTAVKLLRPEITGPETIARFEREVQLTSRLTHPNTVLVYDYGRTAEGLFYYAMELLDGEDLDALVERSGPVPPERIVRVLAQVCASLSEAHGLGLVHRDIKPGNIMLCVRAGEPDVVKVLDFGLVKEVTPQAPGVTAQGEFVGTPRTAAPEVFLGRPAGPASDLYSLGVVAWHLATGEHLFPGNSPVEVAMHHLQTPPEMIRRRRPDFPADLDRLILSCLAKDPAARPASAAALRASLLALRLGPEEGRSP